MGITMKKLIAAAVVVTITLVGLTPAQAAAKVKCTPTKAVGHAEMKVKPAEKPSTKLPKTFTLTTNCGTIVITTVGNKAPWTLTEMSTLAKAGYFDGSLCHRLTTAGIYVLQCGDPTATGLGGPNFTYRDENLPATAENNYPTGVVAMHNSGQDSNGSQFFIFYADSSLPPSYTIWGKVTKGLEIVQMVAKSGVMDGKKDGSPKQKIGIEKVKVR
jgi:peptidyl-prolyl cis-trans isomerase B (cyclophilin B)